MNLITNAIKFTSLQTGKRQITTRLGASLERPTGHGTVVYRNGDQVRLQDIPAADWGSGEVVYILITVEVLPIPHHKFFSTHILTSITRTVA